MKNFLRVALCLSLVFVLSKLEMGRGTVYFKADGNVTSDINEAHVFETIRDAYHFQIEHDGWDIIAR